MRPPAKPTASPKITLSDGSVFELLPDETVEQALARADILAKTGIKPAPPSRVKSDISDPNDPTTTLMDALDREKTGTGGAAEKLMLSLARGSGKTDEHTIRSRFVAAALRKLVGRVEQVNGEIGELQEDRREIYKEVAIFGFDVSAVKRVVRLRKLERTEREERAALDELYLGATESGDGADIPLPGLPKAKKTRKASQARIKKDAARDAQLAAEKQASAQAAAHIKSLRETSADVIS